MAKKEEEKKPAEKEGGGKKKRQHLHEIRSTQAHDGSIVHHHTYKDHKDAAFSQPERGPMATSSTPEEAGQHVAEMFGQNQGAAGPGPGAEPEAGAGPEEAAAGGPGPEPGGPAEG